MAKGRPNVKATPEQIDALRQRLVQRCASLDETGELVRHYMSTGLLSENTIQRFLTGCNNRIDPAEQKLLEHLAWRKSFRVDTILEEDFHAMDREEEMCWRSTDLQGHPVLFWRPRLHDPKKYSPQTQARYIVYKLEQGLKDFEPAEQFVTVIDCRGLSRRNLDFKMIKATVPVIEQNYPERQFAAYVMPVSSTVNFVWKFIGAFLDAGTVFKYRLLTSFDDPSMNENFDAELIQAFKDSLTETTDLNVETQSCNGDDESSVANRNLYSTAKPVGQRVSGDQGTIESLQIVQLKQSQYLQQNDMLAQKAALHELIWEGALCSNPIGMVHSQTEGRPWEWLPVFVRIFKFTQNASSCICIFNSRADQSKVFLKHYQCCEFVLENGANQQGSSILLNVTLWMRGDTHAHSLTSARLAYKHHIAPAHGCSLHFVFAQDSEREEVIKQFRKSIVYTSTRHMFEEECSSTFLHIPEQPYETIGGPETQCACAFDLYDSFISNLHIDDERSREVNDLCACYDALCEELSDADRPKHMRNQKQLNESDYENSSKTKRRWTKFFQSSAIIREAMSDTFSENQSSQEETKSEAADRPKARRKHLPSLWKKDGEKELRVELDRVRLAFTREHTLHLKFKACTRSLARQVAQQEKEAQELRAQVHSQSEMIQKLLTTCASLKEDAKANEFASLAAIESVRVCAGNRVLRTATKQYPVILPLGQQTEVDGITLLNKNKVCLAEVDDALALVKNLLDQITAMFEANCLVDSHTVMEDSEEFKDFCLDTAQLQRVSTQNLSGENAHRFYLCAYNLICMHASVALRRSMDDIVGKYSTLVAYDIGGEIHTVAKLMCMLG